MEQLKTLTDESLTDLCAMWNIKDKNISLLEKKISDTHSVVSRFFSLDANIQKIIYHLLFSFNENENVSVREIAEKFNVKTKRQVAQKINIEELLSSGFVYVKKRRAKLNATDDIIIIIEEIKKNLEKVFVQSVKEIENIRYEDKYVKSVFKEYFPQITEIYSFGKYFEVESFKSLSLSDKTLSEKEIKKIERIKAETENNYNLFYENGIIDYHFLYENESVKTYISISNIFVIKETEKLLREKGEDIEYLFNHANIFYDIDIFINKLMEYKVKAPISAKLKAVFENDFVGKNVSFEYIYDACLALSLIKIEDENTVLVNKNACRDLQALSISERKEYFKSILLCDETYKIISGVIKNKDFLVREEIKREINSVSLIKYSNSGINKCLYNMFMLGLLKAGFDGEDIVCVSPNNDEHEGKCILTGSFEFMLLPHASFKDDFIYICLLHTQMHEKAGGAYVFNITEESVSSGKIISKSNPKYGFEVFVNALKEKLSRNGYNVQPHFDNTLKRWFDKAYNVMIYENAFLIKLTNSEKLEELIHSLKRSHIEVVRIGNEYAALPSDKQTKIKLLKFFRMKKINIDFSDFDDTNY